VSYLLVTLELQATPKEAIKHKEFEDMSNTGGLRGVSMPLTTMVLPHNYGTVLLHS